MKPKWIYLPVLWSVVAMTSVCWGDDPLAVDHDAPPPPMDAVTLPPAPQAPTPLPVAPAPAAPDGVSPHNIVPQPGPVTVTPQATPGTLGAGPAAGQGPFWAPGGYEARIGSPYLYHDPAGGQYVVTGNPYYDHFGPGFHRSDLHGHYRFPYYNYRAPWYYPGRAVYNRDTNRPW